MSFKHEKRRNDTELSKYLWKLKEKKEGYSISWKIIAKAKAYSNTTKRCNLCITEKFFILSNPQMATLNKRNELISNCRHRRKYILKYSWNFVYCIISASRFFFSIAYNQGDWEQGRAFHSKISLKFTFQTLYVTDFITRSLFLM